MAANMELRRRQLEPLWQARGRRQLDLLMHTGNYHRVVLVVCGYGLGLTLALAVATSRAPRLSAGFFTILAICLVSFALAVLGTLSLVKRHHWKARWRACFKDVQGRLPQYVGPGQFSVSGWLEAFWPSVYEDALMRGSLHLLSHAFTVSGYAGLLIADPEPMSLRGRFGGLHARSDPRIHIFIAAAMPDGTTGPAMPASAAPSAWNLLRQLAGRGFSVNVSRAGLLAIAEARVAAALKGAPEGIAQAADAALELAHLTWQLGGEPVGAVERGR